MTRDLAFVPVLGSTEPWRFLTAAFAHAPGQVLHILFNMYALWQIGQYLEPMLGRVRFAILYLVSAFGGSVGYLLLASPPPLPLTQTGIDHSSWVVSMVGASGAVFGLFGALLVLNRHLGRSSGPMFGVLAINAVLGFVVPGIAWQAHLGGLLTGRGTRRSHHPDCPSEPPQAPAAGVGHGDGAARHRSRRKIRRDGRLAPALHHEPEPVEPSDSFLQRTGMTAVSFIPIGDNVCG